MHFEGAVTINAPRERVWQFLTDPQQVSRCAPGVESVEIVIPDRKFRAVASVGFGSVKARFDGEAEFLELDPPTRAKIKAHGSAPGSAGDVVSEMILRDGPDGATEMKWTADVTILGTIASLAARMMGSLTQRLTAEFFTCMKRQIEG